jgi:uncharacterized protein (PEP-CTERM system associated)
MNDVYEQSVSLREDDLTQFNMSLSYQLKRWITVKAAYLHDERDSNVDTTDFDRNVFSIGVVITL